MKYLVAFFGFFLSLIIFSCDTKSPEVVGGFRRLEILDSVKSQALVPINNLGSVLQSNLKLYLSKDSTGIAALDYCKLAAMPLTKELNKDAHEKIKVRRTALKHRNEKNKPDDIDIEVMKTYMLSADKKTVDIIETHDGYRVYKPLFMNEACLKCHGPIKEMNRNLIARLKSSYPQDEAIGYKLEEFRGVIVADVKR